MSPAARPIADRPPQPDPLSDPGRPSVFGPLGFYEILFILAIAFLLLGPRQMSVLSSNLGRTLRDFYKATSDVRRQINAERAALEEEIRREQKPLADALDEMKQLDRTVRQEAKAAEGAWSRRNVLGQNEPTPKVRPQALPEQRASAVPEGSGGEEESVAARKVPEIRTPSGLAARGSLDDPPRSSPSESGTTADSEPRSDTTGNESADDAPIPRAGEPK